jgi:hypothetical protein
MSASPEIDRRALDEERRRLNQRLEEVSRLSEGDSPPGVFYGEMLRRLLESLAAPAGAVWMKTVQGNLQLQFQINLKDTGLDQSEASRVSHDELLRSALAQGKPFHMMPRTSLGGAQEGQSAGGNPTDFIQMLVPVQVSGQVAGLIEVWQGGNRALNAIPGFLQYMGMMADLCARYARNQMMAQLSGQQQVWTQLETFSRQVHGSLNVTEVSYLISNEGRRLVQCDRVCMIASRHGAIEVTAISGADVVEKRSNLVQTLRGLCKEVMKWGERLEFQGVRDDTLPPKVLQALDNYLAESGSKLLVVQPLRKEEADAEKLREREKAGKKPEEARAALVMECFDPPLEPQQIIGRMDVIARHSASAITNALDYDRVPMQWMWLPVARFEEMLGGRGKAILAAVICGVAGLASALAFMPYPLKMEASGQLLPEVRRKIFPPTEGIIRELTVSPGQEVEENGNLGLMHDSQLESQIRQLLREMKDAQKEFALKVQQSTSGTDSDRFNAATDAAKASKLLESKRRELAALVQRTNALASSGKVGWFHLKSPGFIELTAQERESVNTRKWTVLSTGFKEELTNRAVKPSDELLRVGVVDGPWEIELRIPQQHLGQVLQAFQDQGVEELDVDFILRSNASRKWKGKLSRSRIGGEALPSQEDKDNPEPVVTAFVRIDDPELVDRLRNFDERSGTEVKAKIRCGTRKMGYALFYGVWEFIYEKIVFFF